MWKGTLRLNGARLPVKLYAAVEDTDVHFHLLHDRDEQRVEQRLVHAETGEAVPSEGLRKGFPLEPGVYVMLEPEEIAKLAPPASRDVEVGPFVPADALESTWFERPYHLGPDGSAAQYQALARALEAEQRQGLARWVMRGKTYTGVLRSQDGALVLIVLRDREEVVAAPAAVPSARRTATEQEVALAEQLVDALTGELDLAQLENEHRERVRQLVAQKARGKKVRLVKPKTRRASGDALVTALRGSLKKAGARTPGRRAAPQRRKRERKSA
jgi:DNA end-binding protein Ku